MDTRIESAARSSTASRIAFFLFSAAMLTAIVSASGAFADPGRGQQDRDHEQRRGDDHRGDDRRGGRQHRPVYHRGPDIRYAQPVYVPAPEYYPPQQSPGISLFLPLDLRH